MMQHVEKASNKPIVTTKGFSIVVFQCSVIVLKEIESHLATVAMLNEKPITCST